MESLEAFMWAYLLGMTTAVIGRIIASKLWHGILDYFEQRK